MTHELRKLRGEYRSPQEEDRSLQFQFALLEEAGMHRLLQDFQRIVAGSARSGKVSIELEARVRNAVVLRSNDNLQQSVKELGLPGVTSLLFASVSDDLPETESVRTRSGPFLRLSYYYDIGKLASFERNRNRDEVSIRRSSYNAIVFETSPNRDMRIYHRSYHRDPEIVRNQKVMVDHHIVDEENAFYFPYYTHVMSGIEYELNTIPLRSGWSSQDREDRGILDATMGDDSLKIPEAAFLLLRAHPPFHSGKLSPVLE